MDDDANYNPRAALVLARESNASAQTFQISPELWRLLASNLPADMEVDEILQSPALHAEVKRAAPIIRERAAGCGTKAALRECERLLLHFRDKKEEGKSAAFWRPYGNALGAYPLESVTAAVDSFIENDTEGFFPNPGPLKVLAGRHAAPLLKAASRAMRAANSLPRPQRSKLPEDDRMALVESLMEPLRRVEDAE